MLCVSDCSQVVHAASYDVEAHVKAGPLLPRNCTLYSNTSQIEMYLYLNMPLNEDVEFFLQKQNNITLIRTVRSTNNRIKSHLYVSNFLSVILSADLILTPTIKKAKCFRYEKNFPHCTLILIKFIFALCMTCM